MLGYDRILKISFLFLFFLSIPTVQGAIIFDGDINTFTRPGGGLLQFDQGFLADRIIFEENLVNIYNMTYDSFWELVGFDVPANMTMLVTTINNNTITFEANPTETVQVRVKVGTKGTPIAVIGADSWAYIPANQTVNMNISNILPVSLYWNEVPIGFCNYVVTSFANITGAVLDGTFQDTWVEDGHHMTLSEVVGTPGFNYIYNISDIQDVCLLQELQIVERYTGNVGHTVTIRILNYTSGLYEIFDTIIDSPIFISHSINITGLNGDIVQNGTMSIQFYHDSPGNQFHTLEIDYIFLTNQFTPDVITLEPWDINWLMSLLWLVLVALGTFQKNKIIIMFAGFFGLILTVLLMSINMLVAVALLCVNLYLLYEGTE